MKPIISDCETFLEYEDMQFMAFDTITCDGCYFHLEDDPNIRCSLPGPISNAAGGVRY